MRNRYLLETQEIVCLGNISRGDVGMTELLSESSTLSQRPVLNSGREEGRRADFLPQVETGQRQWRSARDRVRRTLYGSSNFERNRDPA